MARYRLSLSSLCFGFFLVANPAYFTACSVQPENAGGFQYDEADMLLVVEQLNNTESLPVEFPLELSGYKIEFDLVQATSSDTTAQFAPGPNSWLQTAHACNQRTFVKEAGACTSSSYLQLEGIARIKDGATVMKTVEVSGSMDVHSNLLSHAYFLLNFEGGDLSVEWDDEAAEAFSSVVLSGDLNLDEADQDGLGGARGGF